MRKPTPEQQERAAARRDAFRALAKRVGAMSEADRAQLAARLPGITTVEGHTLSITNQCLIALQRPTATIVGGFGQWIKAGRVVNKDEHGFMAWRPIARKADPNRQPGEMSSADGDRPGFVPVTYFDVAQTSEAGSREGVAA